MSEIKMAEKKLKPMTEGMEKGLLILREIVAPLRHDIPFKLVIDYDPGKERSEVTIQLSEKSLQLHNLLEQEYFSHQIWRPVDIEIRREDSQPEGQENPDE